MTISIPSAYQAYVSNAAKQLGIPESVVAAQIQLESDWNPNAVSSAGAEGIAQFLPSTFNGLGVGGSPFNPADAFKAYVAYMGQLLKQEGGDVHKALEAYNAGPGNLKAGSGYAATILSRAGQGTTLVSAPTSPSSPGSTTTQGGAPSNSLLGGLFSWPGEIVNLFGDAYKRLEDTYNFFHAFFSPSTYIRIGAGLFGFLFVILGIVCLAREAKGA